jgi:HD-GYP domain-containing protein (c-di-GMP phosphodiesterase class II)
LSRGLSICRHDDVVTRVAKQSTCLELLAKSESAEVSRQTVEAGRHFYLYASNEWEGFEFIYILSGSLSIESASNEVVEQSPVVLKQGDYIYHNGLLEKVYCRVDEAVELLLFSSAPGFDLACETVVDIAAMWRLVEEKDEAMQGHCNRIERWAVLVGERLGLTGRQMIDISFGAGFHDVGKVKLPIDILNKEDELTDAERNEMKRHTDYGAEILLEKGFLCGAAEIVRGHHEHIDGTGYPQGLVGEEIPIGARIVAVVDAYDAMTSVRPRHKVQAQRKAIQELERAAGTRFDPDVVVAFLKVLSEEGESPNGE